MVYLLTFKKHLILSITLSSHYGIHGIVNDWFSSYLSNRIQTTQVGPHVSRKESTLCGVPQGSVLGPLLFLIYVHDIYMASDKLTFYLFADDTNFLYADKNLKSLETIVNCELTKVVVWLIPNKLSLNIKKTNYIIFHPYQKHINFNIRIKAYDSRTKTLFDLERKDHVKYLGVIIDQHLSWKHHINYIALKISRNIGIISRLRHFVPLKTLLSIYNSLIFALYILRPHCLGPSFQISFRKTSYTPKESRSLDQFSAFQNACDSIFRSI